MIEFRDVSLAFGNRTVLDRVSFSAEFYERIAVLGGSGGGKTTILRLLLGLLRPDSGGIFVDGTDITLLSEADLRPFRMRFSIVFQEGALFDSMSVKENVAFCLREYTNFNEDQIDSRVRELLKVLKIEHSLKMMPEELSGGMQRRVAIARSLAECEPKMMLYDEATTGLDPLTADNICMLIRDLSKGEPPERTGFIIVTHKVADAVKVADRYIYIRGGEIAFDGDLYALRKTEDAELRMFINELFVADKGI